MPEMEEVLLTVNTAILAGSDPLDPDSPKTNIGDVDEDEIG